MLSLNLEKIELHQYSPIRTGKASLMKLLFTKFLVFIINNSVLQSADELLCSPRFFLGTETH